MNETLPKKIINIELTQDLHAQFKSKVARNHVTMKGVIIEFIRGYK